LSLRKALLGFALGVVTMFFAAPAAMATIGPDYSAPDEAWNILPPGQQGSNPPGVNSFSQVFQYDGLTPNFGVVDDTYLPFYFKPNKFGVTGATVSTTSPPGHPGVVIKRDNKGVPHIEGTTRADTMFGVGFASVQDRGLLMEALRYPGRLAALDAPGVDAFGVVFAGRTFTPSAQTEAFMASQINVLLDEGGAEGAQVVQDIDDYVAGINLARTIAGIPTPAWTRNDVLAVGALLGARFGKGGGDEARRAQFLSSLRDRLGPGRAKHIFDDLRGQNVADAPTTIAETFRLGGDRKDKGNTVIDSGSLDPAGSQAAAVAQASQAMASNALLLGAERSATGRPLMVAGPQVGYAYPGLLMEWDAHGGGIEARGAAFPGSLPYVQLGRGPDFAWSATSSGTDIIDTFAEELCDGSDTKYLFRGECVDMTSFNAGTLGPGAGPPAGPVTFNETVHGPVNGYATVDGENVALSSKRSTRGREAVSAIGFKRFNDTVDSPASFLDAANKIELTFNWHYADNENIGLFSSGRTPIRHGDVDLGLPTNGTGKYEWRGFVKQGDHPQTVNPASGEILQWNNKPAPGWTSADDEWSYQSVHRQDLLKNTTNQQPEPQTLGSLTNAMNTAATQDLRTVEVLPVVKQVLETGTAPTPREQQMLQLLQDWRDSGSSRLDADGDGKIDAAGAAIMDQAWNKIADAVMSPVLGPNLAELATLITRSNNANNQGSSYGSGWYGYVDKDLRSLLHRNGLGAKPADDYKTKFCGQGDLGLCRDAIWNALKVAGDELAAAQGTNDPSLWRKSATPERIVFQAPVVIPITMRWTNRPTFQQVISFDSHR
jgi:acyl-homoserine lactone acylase PvdQ